MYGKLLTDQLHTKEYLEASQQHPADIMAKSKGGTVGFHHCQFLTIIVFSYRFEWGL